MAKLIRDGQIEKHEAGALLVASWDDFDDNQKAELQERYGVDDGGTPILQSYDAWLRSQEDWDIGRLAPVNLGTEEEPKHVVFICVNDREGKVTYAYIRQALLLFKEKAEKLPSSYFACGVLGRAHGDIYGVALDLVITAALGNDIAVDIFDVNLQPA